MPKFIILVSLTFFLSCAKEKLDSTPPESTFMASKNVENRKAIIEHYCGVRCRHCPDGDEEVERLKTKYGDSLISIGIKSGFYAVPATGWANFTSPLGDSVSNIAGIHIYPTGTVNRHLVSTNSQLPRNEWDFAISNELQKTTPVNIGAKATYNSATRELLIDIDVYYSGNGIGDNKLNVVLTQSGLVAKQLDDGGPKPNYVHNDVLRTAITDTWGTTIHSDSTTVGSQFSTSMTYTLPLDFNGPVIPPGGGLTLIEDMNLIIFISEGKTDIYTGIEVEIDF
ncbi:MAG: Omp28-related outer membrane protein [Schleiferiaceae bacterium]|jgi:hypothetical protein|nr:Omp28-related outer membrane protein [Schleiferiaceae bacterium]